MPRKKNSSKEEQLKQEWEDKIAEAESINFDGLKWAAIELLALNSLTTISSLISVSRIEPDYLIPTACIGREGRRIVIRYNPIFIYEKASRPIEFAGILAHEIFHEILSHLDVQRPGNKVVWNIAYDSIIQSTLNQMNRPPRQVSYATYKDRWSNRERVDKSKKLLPDSGFHITTIFEKLYDLEGVYSLLRPPSPLKRISNNETTGDVELDMFREKVYPEYGPSFLSEVDIYKFIMRKFPEEAVEECKILLIGDIGEAEEGSSCPSEGESENEQEGNKSWVKGLGDLLPDKVIEQICNECDKVAGHSTTLSSSVRKVIAKKNKNLEMALDRALIDNVRSKIVAGIGVNRTPGRGVVIPSQLSRTDLVKISSGYYPVFFDRQKPDGKRTKCNVYIDVSGSVDSYIPWLYGCVIDLQRITDVSCYLFSNKVVPISMEDLEAGKVNTTGGTDFDCIIEHALESNVQKSVIFTDGYANASKNNIDKAKSNGLIFIGACFAVVSKVSKGYNYDTHKYEYEDKIDYPVAGLETFCVSTHKVPLIINEEEEK